ncbi:MAG: DUF16 domain-containing protein [Mycoplasmataceae bacterium]|jgi:predicted nuclease with TOPRIM domain|nr:DUF16 domain-containing protein [Mycoplasmataceae bacterium]
MKTKEIKIITYVNDRKREGDVLKCIIIPVKTPPAKYATVEQLKELDNRLTSQINDVKQDVKVLKEDVIVLKQDVKVLKQDVKTLKESVVTLEQKVEVLTENVDKLNQITLKIWQTLEVINNKMDASNK